MLEKIKQLLKRLMRLTVTPVAPKPQVAEVVEMVVVPQPKPRAVIPEDMYPTNQTQEIGGAVCPVFNLHGNIPHVLTGNNTFVPLSVFKR